MVVSLTNCRGVGLVALTRKVEDKGIMSPRSCRATDCEVGIVVPLVWAANVVVAVEPEPVPPDSEFTE